MNQLALELDGPRITRQCAAILRRLRTGPVTNHELAKFYALKYTSRVSDLRKQGYDVRVLSRNHATGETIYALFVNGERAA